ncbi:MAG: type II secretion system protein [Patescibacteria group bacterium]
MKKYIQNGFSLVEILVVIAIIGILASRQIVNLNRAREKARLASLQETLQPLVPLAQICFDNDEEIMDGATPALRCNNSPWTPEGTFCQSDVWPRLKNGAIPGTCTSDLTNKTFSFSASVDGVTFTCNQTGCTKSP